MYNLFSKRSGKDMIKRERDTHWRGCGEKRTLVHCWWECKLVLPLWKTLWRFLKKLKRGLPYDPAIPLLGIFPKKIKTLILKNICTPLFTVAFFTTANIWEQPKCPSIDEWIKKTRYMYKMDITQLSERMKSCHLQQHGWT